MNIQHQSKFVDSSKLPTSLNQMAEIISKSLSTVIDNTQKNNLIKQYFDEWYQCGLPIEWGHFKNFCENISKEGINIRTENEDTEKKEYWWEKI